MTPLEAHHLVPWEEGSLRLDHLAEDGSWLVASSGGVQLCLPLYLKADLAKHLGQRIAILRNDIDYRMRILDDQS